MLMHLLFHKANYRSLLQFVSERKQIAVFRHEKLFELSRAVLRDKSLRNEVCYERTADPAAAGCAGGRKY